MRFFLYTLVVFSLALGFPLTTTVAQTSSELSQKIEATKRERDALFEEQKRLQAALDELSVKSSSLQGEVKSLDAARAKLANDLKITQTSINKSNLELQKLGKDINQNESEIESHREAIKDSLRKLKSYDSFSMIYALLAYDSMEEVWSDTNELVDLQDGLREEISELERTQEDLLRNKTERERKQIELVGLSRELKSQKSVADETRTAQARLLAETKQMETEYQRMLAENKARHEEFERQLSSFENQLKASDQKLVPIAKRGILSWPVDKPFVTQYFGYTAAARLLYKNTHHNGIDLRASVGTRILSARGGIVKGMGNTDEQRGCYSYGRWVLIEHDNGLSTLYAHLSGIAVTTGQAVATGQVIGYSGGQPRQYGSGASTGPHLHFGVYASAGVRITQYVTSVNCKNVSIPLANPQDYLDPIAYLPQA
jgi:murein DD-endopeptidase MepM/ murein hydrolase activator NlpD